MKKHLLLVAALSFGMMASAQFTTSNAPAIGDGSTMYLLDSNATDYASEIGTGAVWDYSTVSGYDDGTGNPIGKTVSVLDATSTANASDYPTSTNALDIQDVITQYYTESATGRESQGFMFTEATLGDIIGKFDTDAEQLLTYPFALNDNVSDIFSGSADAGTFLTGIPVDGNNTATVDGKGTLMLGNSQTFTDVIRYKLQDTMNATVTGFGNMQMVRTQYEYYKFGNSITNNLPLFIHVHIVFGQVGSATPMKDANVVLSAVQNGMTAGVTNVDLSNFSVYPNPAKSVVTVQLPSSVNQAKITVKDALGREVISTQMNNHLQQVDLSQLRKGLYFITLSNHAAQATKRLIVR